MNAVTATTAVKPIDPADHLKLVGYVMHKLRFKDDDDLKQEGYVGLMHAARNCDRARGKFGTYAYRWIRCSLWKHVVRGNGPVTLPRYAAEVYYTAMRKGTTAGMPAHQVAWVEGIAEVKVRKGLSLDHEPISDPKLGATNQDINRIDDADEIAVLLRKAGLGVIQRANLLAYYGLDGGPPRGPSEIARERGCSRAAVGTAITKALAKLRKAAGQISQDNKKGGA